MLLLNIHFPFAKEIVSFLLWIDSVGYNIFSIFYDTFLKLAQQEIFKENAFDTIYNNIYLIIGVVALFLMAYMLLKMMINPDDNNSSKQIRDMGVRFIVSVLLIVLLPTFFAFLRDFQNSLLEYNVVPKVLLDTRIAIQQVDENGNYIGEQEFIDSNDINLTTELMKYRRNEMVATLISGLMYPLQSDNDSYDGEPAEKKFDEELGTYRYYNSDGTEWSTNVSEWWDGSSQAWTSGIGCAVGATGLVIFTVVTGGWGAIVSIGLGSAALACLAGGTAAYFGGSAIAAISASEYTWTNALQAITIRGNYSQISLFAESIVDGRFHYTPVLSTIVVFILVYIMISFCIDIVVRQAKLIFYQLLAPICFLMSVNPKSKDMLGKWFKLVFTCWFEVFERIALLCAIVLLVGKLDLGRLTTIFHPIISTFIILGIVIFARQIPKLLEEVTGIKSGNMKLGIRDKLKEGGFFAAANAIGGTITGRSPMATIRGFKHGLKNADFKGVGDEYKRRQAYEDALESGAKRRQILMDSFLGSTFGIPTKADREAREIDKRAENVEVKNDRDIKYIDPITGEEKTLKIERVKVRNPETGQMEEKDVYLVDDQMIKNLEAQKSVNIQKMSAFNEEIRNIDKISKFVSAHIQAKGDLKTGEIEKKIDEEGSKIFHTITYYDQVQEVEVEKRDKHGRIMLNADGTVMKEKKMVGVAGTERTFTGNYAQIREFITRDLSPEQRQIEELKLDKIRDDMIIEWGNEQWASESNNKSKEIIKAELDRILYNEGKYDFEGFAYDEDGKVILDEDGNEIIQKGTIKVAKNADGSYRVERVYYKADGSVDKENPNSGVLTGDIDPETGEMKPPKMGMVEIMLELDKIAKSHGAVLNARKQRIDEVDIEKLRTENEDIDATVKSAKEAKDAAKQDVKQRQREASKTYIGNRGGK